MKNMKKIMEVALPHTEAADLTTRAAKAGVPTSEFIGIQALAGAYGLMHPEVQAFHKRVNNRQSETKTQGPKK